MAEQESTLRPGERFRIREGEVAWRRVVDDMVLLDIEHSVYHGLNRTGAIVWQGVANGKAVSELVELVSTEFPEAAEEAVADVPRFLVALLDAGLIERATEVEPPASQAG